MDVRRTDSKEVRGTERNAELREFLGGQSAHCTPSFWVAQRFQRCDKPPPFGEGFSP
jgi:hypothetical protein